MAFLRDVVDPFVPATEEEIKTAEEAYKNDENDLKNIVNYASVLARSKNAEQIKEALNLIERGLQNEESKNYVFELYEDKVLCLFRLRLDKECQVEITKLSQEKKTTRIISTILQYYETEKHNSQMKLLYLVAILVFIAAAVFVFLRSN